MSIEVTNTLCPETGKMLVTRIRCDGTCVGLEHQIEIDGVCSAWMPADDSIFFLGYRAYGPIITEYLAQPPEYVGLTTEERERIACAKLRKAKAEYDKLLDKLRTQLDKEQFDSIMRTCHET